jgi:MFS family permease
MAFIIGAGMFGAIIMVPLYLQIVQGNSATAAGLKLIPFMIGIVSMSIYSGKTISKHGHYKRFPIIGLILMAIGVGAMTTLAIHTPYWKLAIYACLIGMGLGFSMQTIVIALQNSIEFKDMGVSTSANTFFRSVGGTIGVTIFGAVYASKLAHELPKAIASVAATNPTAMAGATPEKFAQLKNNTAVLKTFTPQLQEGIMGAFVKGFHSVFITALPVILVGLIFAFILKETPLRTSAGQAAAREDAAGETLG